MNWLIDCLVKLMMGANFYDWLMGKSPEIHHSAKPFSVNIDWPNHRKLSELWGIGAYAGSLLLFQYSPIHFKVSTLVRSKLNWLRWIECRLCLQTGILLRKKCNPEKANKTSQFVHSIFGCIWFACFSAIRQLAEWTNEKKSSKNWARTDISMGMEPFRNM